MNRLDADALVARSGVSGALTAPTAPTAPMQWPVKAPDAILGLDRETGAGDVTVSSAQVIGYDGVAPGWRLIADLNDLADIVVNATGWEVVVVDVRGLWAVDVIASNVVGGTINATFTPIERLNQ